MALPGPCGVIYAKNTFSVETILRSLPQFRWHKYTYKYISNIIIIILPLAVIDNVRQDSGECTVLVLSESYMRPPIDSILFVRLDYACWTGHKLSPLPSTRCYFSTTTPQDRQHAQSGLITQCVCDAFSVHFLSLTINNIVLSFSTASIYLSGNQNRKSIYLSYDDCYYNARAVLGMDG
jgi:hypothetical protein